MGIVAGNAVAKRNVTWVSSTIPPRGGDDSIDRKRADQQAKGKEASSLLQMWVFE